MKPFRIAIKGDGLKRFIFSSPLTSVSLFRDASHQGGGCPRVILSDVRTDTARR
jgi:hypothetical protein